MIKLDSVSLQCVSKKGPTFGNIDRRLALLSAIKKIDKLKTDK